MIADHLTGIVKSGAALWKIADNLRADAELASNDYFMLVMRFLILLHLTNRY